MGRHKQSPKMEIPVDRCTEDVSSPVPARRVKRAIHPDDLPQLCVLGDQIVCDVEIPESLSNLQFRAVEGSRSRGNFPDTLTSVGSGHWVFESKGVRTLYYSENDLFSLAQDTPVPFGVWTQTPEVYTLELVHGKLTLTSSVQRLALPNLLWFDGGRVCYVEGSLSTSDHTILGYLESGLIKFQAMGRSIEARFGGVPVVSNEATLHRLVRGVALQSTSEIPNFTVPCGEKHARVLFKDYDCNVQDLGTEEAFWRGLGWSETTFPTISGRDLLTAFTAFAPSTPAPNAMATIGPRLFSSRVRNATTGVENIRVPGPGLVCLVKPAPNVHILAMTLDGKILPPPQSEFVAWVETEVVLRVVVCPPVGLPAHSSQVARRCEETTILPASTSFVEAQILCLKDTVDPRTVFCSKVGDAQVLTRKGCEPSVVRGLLRQYGVGLEDLLLAKTNFHDSLLEAAFPPVFEVRNANVDRTGAILVYNVTQNGTTNPHNGSDRKYLDSKYGVFVLRETNTCVNLGTPLPEPLARCLDLGVPRVEVNVAQHLPEYRVGRDPLILVGDSMPKRICINRYKTYLSIGREFLVLGASFQTSGAWTIEVRGRVVCRGSGPADLVFEHAIITSEDAPELITEDGAIAHVSMYSPPKAIKDRVLREISSHN